MSSGGGGGTTTQTIQNIPDWLQPYYEDVIAEGKKAAALPYVAYSGERIAEFTPEQKAIQNAVYGMGRPEEFGAASTGTGQAGQMALSASRAGLGRALGYTPQAFSQEAAQYYASPYQQGVTDIVAREARKQGQMALRDAALKSAGRGTYGGARQALMETQMRRDIGQQLEDIQTKGSQAGYESAQAQFERDRAAQAGAAALAGQLGTAGLSQLISSSGQMADIGQALQATDLQRLQAQQQIAKQEQQRRQDILSLKYEDFLRQRGYPAEQAAFYSAMVRGLPVQAPGSTMATTSAGNPFVQGVGALAQLIGAGGGF